MKKSLGTSKKDSPIAAAAARRLGKDKSADAPKVKKGFGDKKAPPFAAAAARRAGKAVVAAPASAGGKDSGVSASPAK